MSADAMTAATTHAALWSAIDRLADANGMSVSKLGQTACGYSQAFMPCKRRDRHGKPQWPSTQTLAKALSATGVDFAQFGALVEIERQKIEEVSRG